MILYEKLIAANLPVQSATDQGAISFLPGVTLTKEQEDIFQIIILEHFNKLDKLTRLQVEKSAVTGYADLPEWMKTWTAQDAENYIHSQIFNGWTQAQAETWINTNLTNITAANVSQINTMLAGIRAGMILITTAILTLRGLFIIATRLLVHLRDLVIRYRQPGNQQVIR